MFPFSFVSSWVFFFFNLTLFDFFFDPVIVQECINFHIFMNFLIFLLPISICISYSFSFISDHHCGQKRYPKQFLSFGTLLKLVLWPNLSSVLENVPRVLLKNMYSAVPRSNVLYTSAGSSWSTVLLKFTVSLFIFSLDDPLWRTGY